MNPKLRFYLIYAIPVVLFFAACLLFSFEIQRIRDIVQLRELTIGSLLVALVIGYEIGYHWSRPVVDMTDRFQLYIIAIVVCLVLAVPTATLLNRTLALSPPTTVEGEIFRFQSNRVYVFTERYGVIDLESEVHYSHFDLGTRVNFSVQRGLFGVDFIVRGQLQRIGGQY